MAKAASGSYCTVKAFILITSASQRAGRKTQTAGNETYAAAPPGGAKPDLVNGFRHRHAG